MMWRKNIYLVHSYIDCIHPKYKMVQEHISLSWPTHGCSELRTHILVLHGRPAGGRPLLSECVGQMLDIAGTSKELETDTILIRRPAREGRTARNGSSRASILRVADMHDHPALTSETTDSSMTTPFIRCGPSAPADVHSNLLETQALGD